MRLCESRQMRYESLMTLGVDLVRFEDSPAPYSYMRMFIVMTMLSIDRMTPTLRPGYPLVGYHRWSNLLFIHWRVPAELVAPLIPSQLTLDTWDGDAWIGLVPFEMSGVRPWWSPAVRGISAFLETNVRTYVHYRGRDPGVWFFSLDASNPIAVKLARWFWYLSYYDARMMSRIETDYWAFSSQRKNQTTGQLNCAARLGSPLPCAEPGTLDHFLIERYILYAQSPRGGLYQGNVHHRPYSLRDATLEHCEQSLLDAAGIPVSGEPAHMVASPGVNVEVFPLRRLV